MNSKAVLPFLILCVLSLCCNNQYYVLANEISKKAQPEVRAVPRISSQLTQIMIARGDFPEIEHALLLSVKKAESAKDRATILPDCLYRLFQFYYRAGFYDKAIPVIKRFIDLKKANRDKPYFYLTWHECELADLYYLQNDFSNAIPTYVKVVDAWKDTRRWPELLPALNNLANCCLQTNDRQKAEKLFDEALKTWTRTRLMPGLESEVYFMDVFGAQTLEGYALLLRRVGQNSQANTLQLQAQQIWQNLGKIHVSTAIGSSKSRSASVAPTITPSELPGSRETEKKVSVLFNLAFYYCHRGNFSAAEILYNNIVDTLTKETDHRQQSLKLRKEIFTAINTAQRKCTNFHIAPYVISSSKDKHLGLSNPYLKEFSQLKSRADFFGNRTKLVSKYAYAIPTEKALNQFLNYQPIVEIGAGTGYWASLLRNKSITIVAYEPYPLSRGKNAWHPQTAKSWTAVLPGSETIVCKYPHHTLFMCYPPGRTHVAYNAVKSYKGKHIIYVGESAGVAPGKGQDDFHDLLNREWELVKQIELPQWPGLYDCLYVYKRKPIIKNPGSPTI